MLSLADLSEKILLNLTLKCRGIPLMNKWIQAAFLTLLAAGSGFAGTVSFSGTLSLSQDDNVVLYDFTANSSELITIQSLSYKVGGFAPTAFLFDGLGDVTQLTNGTCAQVGQDPTTLNCDDLYFQDTLGPGSFVLALAVYDNRPVDTSVADGFVEDGNPGFTCVEAGIPSGSFCDVTALGQSRTGYFDLAITGADSVVQVSVPEPGSLLLLLSGGLLIVWRRVGFTFRAE